MQPVLTTIFSVIATLLISVVYSQDNKDNPIPKLIESQRYVFKTRTAMPARGRTIQLTSEYSLTVKQDSVEAYLPYFGRAYTAPIGSTEGGIQFTSTDFSYQPEKRKKRGWTITIKPNDAKDVQQLILTISKNGYGTLHVTSQNRQAISFSGIVEQIR